MAVLGPLGALGRDSRVGQRRGTRSRGQPQGHGLAAGKAREAKDNIAAAQHLDRCLAGVRAPVERSGRPACAGLRQGAPLIGLADERALERHANSPMYVEARGAPASLSAED